WQASLLALVVLIVQKLLGKRLGGRGRYALWSIVLVRLLLPVLPESRFSIFNLMHMRSASAASQNAEQAHASPQATIPIIVVRADGVAKPAGADESSASSPVAAMTVAPAKTTHINWLILLFAAWSAGLLTLMIRIVHICWKLNRTIRALCPVTDPQ